MTADDPSGDDNGKRDSPMRQVWYAVAVVYAGALMYAQVWRQLEVPYPLYVVVACVADPATFRDLFAKYIGDFVKWVKR